MGGCYSVSPKSRKSPATVLAAHGRRIVGWDEILQPSLSKEAIVMSWHGVSGAHAAAVAGAPSPLQDAILTDLEKNAASGFSPDAATFFSLVRTHTIQGMFCDPYYGGNANFIGWDLVGYPGIRMAVGADEQGAKVPQPVRKSAYADAMFTMKGGDHGHRP